MEDLVRLENPQGINIREMDDADLPQVLQIERSCYPDAWPEDEFIDRLQSSKTTMLVAEYQGRIVGFTIYTREWFKLHLENVAVAPSARRKGIARLLVKQVIADLPMQRRRRIILEVRASNKAAQSCYLQLGFRRTGEKAGYYWPDGEDALIMEFRS